MMKLHIRDNKTGGSRETIEITDRETVGAVKQRIKEAKSHPGLVKMHFPGIKGIKKELLDTDFMVEQISVGQANVSGVVVNVELLSDTEDDEQAPGNALKNDLAIDGNTAIEEAEQDNFIVGIEAPDAKRATIAKITGNKAGGAASQQNGIMTMEAFLAVRGSSGARSRTK
ncbi:hypothetical protein NUW58_g1666 [Xylaria curta]|uniref:Uncharacterized protein n=1 Tax=Xylaria curta TaxID=42375 RepID=A0ACC1PL99_9PEZI|nr:hypothetical protein NUW58_g1666 [Xylaria curta]